jgi:hypothetical protein
VLSSVDLFCVLCEEVCSLRKAPKNHDKIAQLVELNSAIRHLNNPTLPFRVY